MCEISEVDDVNVLFGVAYDRSLDNEVRVTLIAAGFADQKVKILQPINSKLKIPAVVSTIPITGIYQPF
ncbi:MAG: hypothetical protein R2865_10705 [Deinococcales bacterium]